MSSTLDDPRVKRVLDQMHSSADRNDDALLARAKGLSMAERTAALSEAFIPVSPEAGRFLYTLARGSMPGTIVEFGTSFGISTIYLAAAICDRGAGRIITTELLANKATRAREYIREAGVSDVVDMRLGDAQETLKDLESDVSLVFLDGAKDLYLPILERLEPVLQPGALVVADDLDLFPEALAAYLGYVRNSGNGYISVTVPIGDAMELSTRTR